MEVTNTELSINGVKQIVNIKKTFFNNKLAIDAVMVSKNFWIHFWPNDGEDINQQIIKMFEDIIKVNKKNRKNNQRLKKDINHIPDNLIIIVETDGNAMLGTKSEDVI